MPTILDEIVAHKELEIASLPSIDPDLRPHRSFIESVLNGHPGIIGELKPKSPSAGELITPAEIPTLVDLYSRQVQGISVLCDEKYFGGGFQLLEKVYDRTDTPILAKEFVLSEKQIDHAAQNGASSVLLIVAILTRQRILQLAQHATAMDLDVLIETHNAEEAEQATATYEALPETVRNRILMGVNNRNLKIMKTDLHTTETVAPKLRWGLPDLRGIISESGIHSRDDIDRLRPHVQGFLIGESILKAPNREKYLQSLHMSTFDGGR